MVYSTNIPNLIGSIIDTIRDSGTITSITSLGTTRTVLTPDTKRLIAGDWVKINSVDYKILTLTTNTSFTIESSAVITATSWTALAPYYFYGTYRHVANNIDKIRDNQNKFPVIVLFETMPASVDDNAGSSIERNVNLQMFFVDEANYEDWSAEDYYTYVIDKMQAYVDEFMAAVKSHVQIEKNLINTHTETPYSKWNLEGRNTPGKNVFNVNLSGIGLDINLPVKKLDC